MIDLDFIFNEVEQKYYPFDFETYAQCGSRFVIVSTNAMTGKAVYTEENKDFGRFVDASRASCSLPLLCPKWHIDGIPMVDGGVADSIPFDKALTDGCKRVVVVSTKDAGYRKSEKRVWMPGRVYKEYPLLREALQSRGERYNRQLDRLKLLENEGVAKVVRPECMYGVGRTTRDAEALEALYAEGLRRGRELAQWMTSEGYTK